MNEFYKGRRVLVTGHTGFKGAWLTEWLLQMGAIVTGCSIDIPTDPSLHVLLGHGQRMDDRRLDINDLAALKKVFAQTQPEIIFHLAAQPLVRESYQTPLNTWQTNVMGTVHVLEAARASLKACTIICVTSDKCYRNQGWVHGYREEDPFGGDDPYSSSKAAAELAVHSWRRSFAVTSNLKLATVRAGNVIGGGDWAVDRIVPDCIRSLARGEPICMRNPTATRPWQHVLEPLSGYLLLAGKMHSSIEPCYQSAFNFGPSVQSNQCVGALVAAILKSWPGESLTQSSPEAPKEAQLLHLNADKAYHVLGWHPRWNFAETIQRTVAWYRSYDSNAEPSTVLAHTIADINAYGVL
jgi:CDP-glucose 4,6-dehydratase